MCLRAPMVQCFQLHLRPQSLQNGQSGGRMWKASHFQPKIINSQAACGVRPLIGSFQEKVSIIRRVETILCNVLKYKLMFLTPHLPQTSNCGDIPIFIFAPLPQSYSDTSKLYNFTSLFRIFVTQVITLNMSFLIGIIFWRN